MKVPSSTNSILPTHPTTDHTAIEINEEPSERVNRAVQSSLEELAEARQKKPRKGIIGSFTEYVATSQPSTAWTIAAFVATGVIWAAGNGLTAAGQQFDNQTFYIIGSSLNSLGVYLVTGGGAVVGGVIGASMNKEAVKKEIRKLMPNRNANL